MENLGALFAFLIFGLRKAIAPLAARGNTAVLVQVHAYTGRVAQRFEKLFIRWQTGCLPVPRTRTSPRAPRAASTDKPRLRFSRRRKWLIAAHIELAFARSQLIHLLGRHPDVPAFLADVPQAKRLLRPLCTMLGVDLDKPTGVPLPPPAPRPAPPGGLQPVASDQAPAPIFAAPGWQNFSIA